MFEMIHTRANFTFGQLSVARKLMINDGAIMPMGRLFNKCFGNILCELSPLMTKYSILEIMTSYDFLEAILVLEKPC